MGLHWDQWFYRSLSPCVQPYQDLRLVGRDAVLPLVAKGRWWVWGFSLPSPSDGASCSPRTMSAEVLYFRIPRMRQRGLLTSVWYLCAFRFSWILSASPGKFQVTTWKAGIASGSLWTRRRELGTEMWSNSLFSLFEQSVHFPVISLFWKGWWELCCSC